MFHARHLLFRTLLPPVAAALSGGVCLAQGQLIDLSSWQTVQYELNSQPDASWDLQPGNTAVLQSVNSDASIYLSDFDAAGQEIRGTWRVETASDDDFMGFVFGYQGRGQYYLFDWKQTTQSFGGELAEAGMCLKVVQMPAGSDPTQDDLWPTVGSANVTVPLHNTIPWVDFVDYEFVLSFVPGTIEITVLEAGQELEHWILADSTYTGGGFGFYNYSQGDVLYQGFTQQGVPEIYCTAKPNSVGCVPTIAFAGYASLTDASPFDITASMVTNGKLGYLTYGVSGPTATPFQGGTLCVQGSLLHTPPQNTGGSASGTDCSGQLAFDFNDWLQNGGSSLAVGDRVNAQYFYRDPRHPDGTGYGLTDAIEFFVLP